AFGMKLARENVRFLEARAEPEASVTGLGQNHRLIGRRGEVGVDEIQKRALGDFPQRSAGPGLAQGSSPAPNRVPADLGNFSFRLRWPEARNVPLDQSQSRVIAELLAAGHEELHPQADPDAWSSAGGRIL